MILIETARSARDDGVEVPLVLMSYLNPLLRHELPRLASDLAAAGADGLIVPDLPFDEAAIARAAHAAWAKFWDTGCAIAALNREALRQRWQRTPGARGSRRRRRA